MHKDLLAHSPLLALPLAALFLFLAVFVVVVLRTFATKRGEIQRAAALPFRPENER